MTPLHDGDALCIIYLICPCGRYCPNTFPLTPMDIYTSLENLSNIDFAADLTSLG